MENVKPIVLTDTETNEVYTLEFTRETVKFAQRNGFNIDDIDTKPFLAVPDLFYYAFRANHKFMTHEKTDKILYDDLGGLPDGALERLAKLYYKPYESLLNSSENKERKNAKMTVEF